MGVRESLLARSVPVGPDDPVDAFRQFCTDQWALVESQSGSRILKYYEVVELLGNLFDYVDPLVRRVCGSFDALLGGFVRRF